MEQARVIVISKLTRNIFKLKNKKGTEVQKAKNKSKAERYAKEILAIKKAKKDEITKFALTNTLTLKEILENKNLDSLTRIMARIADHKKFKDKISTFKRNHPDFADFLGPGRKKKQKLERKEKKKLENTTALVSEVTKESDKNENINKSGVSDIEQLESDSEHSDSGAEDEKNIEDLDENKIEVDFSDAICHNNIEEENKDDKFLDNEISINNKKDVSDNGDSGKNKCSKIDEKNSKPEDDKIKQKKSKKSSSGKHKKTKADGNLTKNVSKIKNTIKCTIDQQCITKEGVIKKFEDIINGENESVDENREVGTDNVLKQNDNEEMDVDPFFLLDDGQSNYMSTAIVESRKRSIANNDNNDEDSRFNNKNFSQKHGKNFPTFSKSKSDGFRKNSNQDLRWKNRQQDENSYKKEKINHKRFEKFNDGRNSRSKFDKIQSNEILHPSWEAKRKQQEMIKQGFQGKKIVFGDED